MLKRLACYLNTTQHPRQFLGALILRERTHTRARGLAVGDFADAEMLVRETGYLRQMSDAQDLSVCSQFLQTTTNHLGYTATDTAVYFVEDHCGYRTSIACDDLNGEAHA